MTVDNSLERIARDDTSPELVARDVLSGSGSLDVSVATIRVAPQERMAWLVRAFGNPRDAFHLWPALVQPSATTVQTTVGPFADTALDLGMFLRIAKRRELTPESSAIYLAYVDQPRDLDDAGNAAIGDGLVVQFVAGGILHTWQGAPVTEPAAASSHPNPSQQEAIDELVAQLAGDPAYRKLPRKTARDDYARTDGTGEVAEVFRGEHLVLPQNFGYRILQDAHAVVEKGARRAYAGVERDEPELIRQLHEDVPLAGVHDRTARRARIRELLFQRYQYAPPTDLVGRLYDATKPTSRH
ncbi:hypothetical protein [Amycolatopsis sp. NPDC051903]|uniref:hypothetical protein n=1 Tax=Amycolatopsis sp. NPDC051903 TaxID=3363936 RepID=UPI00378E11F7